MSLAEKLEQDMKDALRNKEEIRLSTIRLLRSQIKNSEIDKKIPLVDEEIIELIQRGIKQRKEILPTFEHASRQDLIKQTNDEIKVLEAYLPEQLSEEELKQIVAQTIKEVCATSLKDMGKVMGALMPKVKGKADGKVVSDLVKLFLKEKGGDSTSGTVPDLRAKP